MAGAARLITSLWKVDDTATLQIMKRLCVSRGQSATTKGPHDFVIVEGHYDIWEISARTRLHGEAKDFR